MLNLEGVFLVLHGSVVDPKIFFSDPYPTFQEISDPAPDPDPTQLLSKEAKVKF